jgi:hypothetical protein
MNCHSSKPEGTTVLSDTEWKWNDPAARDNIVVQPVRAVAVYTTPEDELVIRQAGDPGDADSVLVIPKLYAKDLMKGILNQLNQDSGSFQTYPAGGIVVDATPDTSHAGRQTTAQNRMDRFRKT